VWEFTCRDADTGEAQSGLHSQIVISGKDGCYIGSANMTRGSLSRDFELGVELGGKTIEPVRSLVERIWQESVIVEFSKQ
jgi:phosphatidylserine/phosphatidylglycerophosphate/cardiolipin synthase-like enzyme